MAIDNKIRGEKIQYDNKYPNMVGFSGAGGVSTWPPSYFNINITLQIC